MPSNSSVGSTRQNAGFIRAKRYHPDAGRLDLRRPVLQADLPNLFDTILSQIPPDAAAAARLGAKVWIRSEGLAGEPSVTWVSISIEGRFPPEWWVIGETGQSPEVSRLALIVHFDWQDHGGVVW